MKNKQEEVDPIITCHIYNENHIPITDPESGEIICSNCGMVISERIEDNLHQERHTNTSEESNKRRDRIGSPTSLAIHDMGLSTIIGRDNKDATGRKLDAATSSAIERLRIWDSRMKVHTSKDRNLMHAFQELDVLKDKLGLSDAIVEKAAYIYRKSQQSGMVRGRSISGILSASLYIACREIGMPRTIKDIAAASNMRRKAVARSHRLLIRELDIKAPIVDPIKCIVKVANNVNLAGKIKREAINMMEEVIKKEITAGKDPMGLAATVLYLSCKKIGEEDDITQVDMARAAGVTEVTIRNRLRDLIDKLGISLGI
jgi:transcription initiation factor TFIIB